MSSIFIGRTNDTMSINVFGLANTFVSLLYMTVIKGLGETTAMKSTYFYSINKDKKVGEFFYKGLTVVMMIYSFLFWMVIISNKWLI